MSTGKGQVHFNKSAEDILRERKSREEAAKAKMEAVKSGGRPVGGVPPVKIPPLSMEPTPGGGTMAAQAEALRDATSPLSPAYSPELSDMAKGPFASLPDEARRDSRFVPGMGSMIAGNQPQLKEPRSVISEKTKQDLETLAALQKEPKPERPAEPTLEQRAEEDKILEEGRKQLEETSTAYRGGGDEYQWNVHNNPTRRKEIEARLKPLDIVDIIQYGEIRQEIEVVPGKLRITLRSVTGEEDLAVKRMMFTESGGDRYMIDKFSLMNMACGVISINNFELPGHLNDKKKFDESLFLKKFDTLMRFPAQFLADIGVQYMWFDERVRQLFTNQTEALKNS
jgi:hypothetical protein